MKKKSNNQIDVVYLSIVIMIMSIITAWFSWSTFYINFWPTDSHMFYLPAARSLFHLQYFSQIHLLLSPQHLLTIVMHGKEALVLAIAIMQKLLQDNVTLFPNIMVLILAVQVSALCIYLILRRFFSSHIAFIGFLLFVTCFWPYLYVLQGAHPPLAMMFMLLSGLLLLYADNKKLMYVGSGICFGLMLFSSPTSPIFIPYLMMFWVMDKKDDFYKPAGSLKDRLIKYLLFALGATLILLLFMMPHPIFVAQAYFRFVSYNKYANHFLIFNDTLKPYFAEGNPLLTNSVFYFRGAGIIWVLKYFFLIMPILFSLYLFSIIYLVIKFFKRPFILFIVILSASTLIGVEMIRVCQFGRNYYSWLIGIIFLVCFALSKMIDQLKMKQRQILFSSMAIFILGHIIFNAQVFFTDAFKTRMAMSYVDIFLRTKGIEDLFIYSNHPCEGNTSAVLNNPRFKTKIRFWQIDNIHQPLSGCIFVPPITGKSVISNCVKPDFTDDPYLTELYESGEIEKYSMGVFPTMASSRIWTQEEEICTYLDLVLGKITEEDRNKGKAYLLDAERLQKGWFNCQSSGVKSHLFCAQK